MNKDLLIKKMVEEFFFSSWKNIEMVLEDSFGKEGVEAGRKYFETLQEEMV